MESNIQTLLDELECPVCNEYMGHVIPMCSRGHSICCNCKLKCHLCPVCKAAFEDARNYTLEKILATVKYPCKNKLYGCNLNAGPTDIYDHMEECEYRFFSCPLNDFISCHWKGKLKNVRKHIDMTHFNLRLDYIYNDLNTCVTVMSAYKSLFKVCRKRNDGSIHWSVQYIGPEKKACNFGFKIEFSEPMLVAGCSLTFIKDCVALNSDKETVDKNCVLIEVDMLNHIVSGKTYEHNFHIISKKSNTNITN